MVMRANLLNIKYELPVSWLYPTGCREDDKELSWLQYILALLRGTLGIFPTARCIECRKVGGIESAHYTRSAKNN